MNCAFRIPADTEGDGAPDLLDATLTTVALDVTAAGVSIEGVAQLTVSGELALATLAPADVLDTRSWFALKMGNVTVSGGLDPAIDIGLSAELTTSRLDYNGDSAGTARLNWASAFDLDEDGVFEDVLDPGADLPTPKALPIDFAAGLELRLSGTLSGTGIVGEDDTTTVLPDDPIDNAFLTVGPLQVTGTAGFALTLQTVDADTDGDGGPLNKSCPSQVREHLHYPNSASQTPTY